MYKRIVTFLFIFTVFNGTIRADIIILKNGGKVEGSITAQSRTTVNINTLYGEKTVAKSDIRRIQYQDYNIEEEREKLKQEQERKRQETERRRLEEEKRNLEQAARLEEARLERIRATRRAQVVEVERGLWETLHRDFRRREDEPDVADGDVSEEDQLDAVLPPTADKSLAWEGFALSALIPGLGSFYQGDSVRGAIWSGGFLASAVTAAYYYDRYDDEIKAMNRTDELQNTLVLFSSVSENVNQSIMLQYYLGEEKALHRKNANQALDYGNAALALTGILYAVNVTDAASYNTDTDASMQTGKALWRSALLPGWGSYYQNRPTRGAIWGGAFALSAGTAILTTQQMSSDLEDLNTLTTMRDILFLKAALNGGSQSYANVDLMFGQQIAAKQAGYNQSLQFANTSTAIALGVYLASLLDVALFDPNNTTSLYVVPVVGESKGVMLGYRF